jgi:hypothetical protein
MNTHRTATTLAGVLFIIGTASGIMSVLVSGPAWNAPDYLLRLSANENLVNLGIMLQFTMAIACAGISVALYPIVKKYSESLAIGAIGFRLAENVLQILYAVGMVILLALSREVVRAGTPAAFQGAAEIIKAANDWMIHVAALTCFSVGASMYYIVFYQHRLVPRWLSGWGLVSLAVVVMGSVLVMLGVLPGFGTVQIIANLSILLQEMVFAVWLIAKGVNPSAVASLPAKPATTELQSAS